MAKPIVDNFGLPLGAFIEGRAKRMSKPVEYNTRLLLERILKFCENNVNFMPSATPEAWDLAEAIRKHLPSV